MVLALTLIGLWLFLLYTPLHKEQAAIVTQIEEARQQLDDFKTIMNKLPGFLKIRKKLEAERSVLRSKLYAKNDILMLFQHLYQQAKDENVMITEISPPIEELLQLNRIIPDSNQIQLLNINLKLQGRYIDFGRFISVVEKSDYFRGITDCKIRGSKAGHGDIQLQLGFNAMLGSLKEKV